MSFLLQGFCFILHYRQSLFFFVQCVFTCLSKSTNSVTVHFSQHHIKTAFDEHLEEVKAVKSTWVNLRRNLNGNGLCVWTSQALSSGLLLVACNRGVHWLSTFCHSLPGHPFSCELAAAWDFH